MKLKFVTFDSIKKFNNLATKFDGDVLLKSGRYIVDGKSIMGILSLSMDKTIDMEIISKNDKEIDSFLSQLRELNILKA